MAGDTVIQCRHDERKRARLVLPGGYVLDYCAACLEGLQNMARFEIAIMGDTP